MTARRARRRSDVWQVEAPRLLLVEGEDEKRFLAAMPDGAGSARPLQVIALGGKHGFRRNLGLLPDRLRQAGVTLQALGVIRDADDNPGESFQSVCDSLRAFGWTPPRRPGEVTKSVPRVGVFILPDGSSEGALETLCRFSVADSVAGNCAASFLGCLREDDPARSSMPVSRSDKAFVHAYLASGKNPVARVGEGADQGVWDFGHGAFAPLARFVALLRDS